MMGLINKFIENISFWIMVSFLGSFIIFFAYIADDLFDFLFLGIGVIVLSGSMFRHFKGKNFFGRYTQNLNFASSRSIFDDRGIEFPQSSAPSTMVTNNSFGIPTPTFSSVDTPGTNPTPNAYSVGTGSYGVYAGSNNPSTFG